MFRLRPDAAAATVPVEVEGRTVLVPAGASAAAAVLLAGLPSIRDSAVSGGARAPYCLMGVCFDCLAEIDGVPNRQSCMVAVRAGMRIRRQRGRRAVGTASNVIAARDSTSLSALGGGEGRGEVGDATALADTHLTRPSLRDGPLPLPPEGRRGET